MGKSQIWSTQTDKTTDFTSKSRKYYPQRHSSVGPTQLNWRRPDRLPGPKTTLRCCPMKNGREQEQGPFTGENQSRKSQLPFYITQKFQFSCASNAAPRCHQVIFLDRVDGRNSPNFIFFHNLPLHCTICTLHSATCNKLHTATSSIDPRPIPKNLSRLPYSRAKISKQSI